MHLVRSIRWDRISVLAAASAAWIIIGAAANYIFSQ